MKRMVFLSVLLLSLMACSQVELEQPQLNSGEFLLEVDYSKSIAETIENCKFGLIDKRIGNNYTIANENKGKKIIVVAAIISFDKEVTSFEGRDLLEKDGRYRGANISELLALSLKFSHPYFNTYIRNPIKEDIGNGLKIVDYANQDPDNDVNSTVIALGAGFFDLVSLPGYSPWMTAYIYDRDIRALELRQEFPKGELKKPQRFYASDAFLVIKN